MRGSLKINFQLNSIRQFLEYTFRLQQFCSVLILSDFAYIPNLSFAMDVVYNVCRYLFSTSRNKQANIGER